MCSPDYHHNGFAATHALGEWAHSFHDCIYIMLILHLRDLSTVCVVDHLWPFIYKYIYIYIYIYIYEKYSRELLILMRNIRLSNNFTWGIDFFFRHLFQLFFSFFLIIFYLSNRFLSIVALESNLMFHFHVLTVFVIFQIMWMLVTVNKLKYMPYYMVVAVYNTNEKEKGKKKNRNGNLEAFCVTQKRIK